MSDFTDKLSPRAIGNGIKSRVSGLVPIRNDPPYNKVINRLTKISKVAKETRYKKRNVSKLSATAMLILSQTDIRFLHRAIVQVSKPAIHRQVNVPLEAKTTMNIDTVPVQQETRPPQQEISARIQRHRACMPALIVGGFRGKDIDEIDQIDQIDPSRILTQNLCALRQAGKWEKRNLQQICLSRAQIAAIERRKEREEDEEEERQRMTRQPPKPLQRGDPIKLWHSNWKAKEWRKKREVFDQPACY
ncbi:hypothetical protein TGAM01_v200846 [Trichoderma gamsii]|uniref:Uncharacterized protein n=1 Tax=Trichoderma gamsii TaxID=398673 RepID=A0A2P5A1I7_9HYPO|nr:hypothetical protein TGAM01_v200846 [Trichoderma gamsii]PON30406.1 hypothetical protein TGAM01_v200846 [Trichoderma gamsii]